MGVNCKAKFPSTPYPRTQSEPTLFVELIEHPGRKQIKAISSWLPRQKQKQNAYPVLCGVVHPFLEMKSSSDRHHWRHFALQTKIGRKGIC